MLPRHSLRRPAEAESARLFLQVTSPACPGRAISALTAAAPQKALGLSRRSVAALALLLALQNAGYAQRTPEPPTSIDIVAQRLPGFDHADSTRRQFGLLEFRGGLVLTSSFKRFGGLSAIR